MTALSEIITDAYREGNIIPLGKTPNAAQTAEALKKLNQIFGLVYGDEAGEAFVDWPLGTFDQANPSFPIANDYYRERPPLNHRIIATNTEAMTVYLPPFPQDGSRMAFIDPYSRLSTVPVTIDGNGRVIEGQASILLNVNATNVEWFYRADLGQWVKIVRPLAATDDMPFPTEFDTFFTLMLALRINPGFGRKMDEQSQAVFKAEKTKFVNRYLQAMPLLLDDSISWPFMSIQGYNQPSVFSSQEAFNRGVGWI